MHLTLERPRKGILPIVAKLLGHPSLKKGEDFEYFPVEPELEGAEGPPTSTPKKGKTLLSQSWLNILNLFRLKS